MNEEMQKCKSPLQASSQTMKSGESNDPMANLVDIDALLGCRNDCISTLHEFMILQFATHPQFASKLERERNRPTRIVFDVNEVGRGRDSIYVSNR